MAYIPRYATGYGISAVELFTRFKTHYIKHSPEPVFNERSKKKIAARIFIYAFWLILKDIIHNNVIFSLPTGREDYIEMCTVAHDDFARARQNGAFQEVDFLKSDFLGHNLQYRFQLKSKRWFTKKICVHRKLKDIITENTNNGVKY